VSKEQLTPNDSLQNTGVNYPHGSSTGKRTIPRPKLLSDKQLDQSKVLPASSSHIWLIWCRKAWNILHDGINKVFGWKELPKGVNQNCFNWRSVTKSAMDSPCPGYGCEDPEKYLRPTPEDAPEKKVSESSSIPANSKPAITDGTGTAKTNESKETSHVPLVMRMSRDYEWNRLPENASSENDEKTMPANLTDNRNGKKSFESQNNPSESKIEHAWSMIVDNPSKVNTGCRWLKKSGKSSCMDNENRVLDFLENETSSSTVENKNSDKVNSSENRGTELEKLLETKQLGRSHGNTLIVTEKLRDVTARFKDLENFSLASGITVHVLTNWSWQDTFDVLIVFWMINFCAVDLYLMACFIKEIIGLLRLQRQRQQEEERERLRELELAAQPKPWRPKPKKKRRKKKNDW